jgi:hypothetical protein
MVGLTVRCLPLRYCLVTMAATVCVFASSAHAADPAEVENLLHEGVQLRREGNDAGALPLFEKAYKLAHTPRTSAQLGMVEFALGYAIDAATHLSEGLAASTDVWIHNNRATLEDTLARVRATIGEIVVTGGPDGAEVYLNSRPVGRLPLAAPVAVGQGPVTMELRAKGFVTASSSVYVVGGQHAAVHLQLVREPSLAPPQLPVLAVPQLVSTEGGPSASTTSSARTTRSIAGWSLIGAGVVSAAAGGFLLVSAKDCVAQSGFQCTRESPSHVPGWALVGAGVAAGVAGTIVIITRPSAHTEIGFGPALVFLRQSI